MLFSKKDKNIDIQKQTNKKNPNINELDLYSGDVGNTKLKKEKKVSGPDKGKKKAQIIKKQKNRYEIPKSVQQSIPYRKVYQNGIIESKNDEFTKTYELKDANFRTATQEAQDDMYFAYGDLLNYFTPDIRPQFTIFNTKVNKEEFEEKVLFTAKGNKYDVLRDDINNVLNEKMGEAQNNITQRKFITVSCKAQNIEIAQNIFGRVDSEISSKIKVINDAPTEPMSLVERLELLYNMYNPDTEIPMVKKLSIKGKEIESFTIKNMQSLGLTTKDIIGNSTLIFPRGKDYFEIGDSYGRSLYLSNIPTQLSADILADLANIPCTSIISAHFSPMRQDEAIKLVRNQMLAVNKNVSSAVQKNAKLGIGADFISPDLMQERNEAAKAYDDITVNEQKSMLMTIVITIFADDWDDLEKFTKIAQNNAIGHLCTIRKLKGQQERGFNSSLPVGDNQVYQDRLMNTQSAALFIPFESQELLQKNGNYYGLNATSHNLIMIDRPNGGQNSNGLILGMPGSGKSFAAKLEMAEAFLSDDNYEIFVIDPQAEYRPLCEALGGQVIEVSPTSKTHINPFDMDMAWDDDGKESDNPIKVKSDYICSIVESAIGGHYGLNPVQTNVIDRCVIKIYDEYLEHMEQLRRSGSKITCDRNAAPTLKEFYELLRTQPESEARYLATAMEKYCVGSYDTFAYKTNVDTNNRFVVYDINKIGTGMNEIGMQICLNDIWNRTMQNKKRGIRTWIYIDELYILTQSQLCSRFLMYMFKQLRKYGGIPTGITQNVEDLLVNRESRALINNCGFIIMLNQSADDRAAIGEMLHISESQLSYIKNADSGSGLIFYGKNIVPFVNKFPKDNNLYKIISTNPGEQQMII